MRVLIAGFSVLMGATREALLAEHGDDALPLDIQVCGLGGLHFSHMTFLVDDMLKRAAPEVMLFDLASTPCREWATREGFIAHAEAMIAKCFLRGVACGFINLWRSDVDPASDPIVGWIDEVAERFRAPVANIGRSLAHDRTPAEIGQLFWDGVHATPAGAEHYRNAVVEFLRDPRFHTPRTDLAALGLQGTSSPVFLASALPATRAVDGPCEAVPFERDGIALGTVALPEDRAVRLALPGTRLAGAFVVLGPRTGDIAVTLGTAESEFRSYDEHAYYPRLTFIYFETSEPGVTLRQRSGRPDIALIKGEPDDRPRIGQVAYLCYFPANR